jgi:hypothetical protein
MNFFRDIKFLGFPVTVNDCINTDFREFKSILLTNLELEVTYGILVIHGSNILTRSGVPFDPVLFTLKSCNDKLYFGLSLDENIQYLINQLENKINKSDIILEVYKTSGKDSPN